MDDEYTDGRVLMEIEKEKKRSSNLKCCFVCLLLLLPLLFVAVSA